MSEIEQNKMLIIEQLKTAWQERKDKILPLHTKSRYVKFALIATLPMSVMNPFWMCTYDRETKVCTVDELNVEL